MVRLRELGCVSCDVIIDVIVAACPTNANFGRAKGGPWGRVTPPAWGRELAALRKLSGTAGRGRKSWATGCFSMSLAYVSGPQPATSTPERRARIILDDGDTRAA